MIYGYARVSTKGQAKDGNSLEVQEQLLREQGATIIYKDSFTGTKKHRPEFDKLLSEISKGDTLVVTKLDRIARSTRNGLEIIDELLDREVSINILWENSITVRLENLCELYFWLSQNLKEI